MFSIFGFANIAESVRTLDSAFNKMTQVEAVVYIGYKGTKCFSHANVQMGVNRLALIIWAHGLQAMSLISIQINPDYSLLNAQSKKLEMISPSKQCSEISNTLKSPSCKAMAMVWLLHDPCVLSCLTGEHFSPQILSAWTCDSLVNGKVQNF